MVWNTKGLWTRSTDWPSCCNHRCMHACLLAIAWWHDALGMIFIGCSKPACPRMLTVSHGFYAMKRRVFHVEMLCVGSHISHISKHSRGISILVIFTSPGYLCFDL